MHPEVVSDGAGRLSEVRHGARAARRRRSTDAPNPELVDMTRRFWVGVVARRAGRSLLAMGDMLPAAAIDDARHRLQLNGVSLLLATPVVFWCGWPFFERCGRRS